MQNDEYFYTTTSHLTPFQDVHDRVAEGKVLRDGRGIWIHRVAIVGTSSLFASRRKSSIVWLKCCARGSQAILNHHLALRNIYVVTMIAWSSECNDPHTRNYAARSSHFQTRLVFRLTLVDN